MTAPTWSPVDDDTADLLTVLADDGRRCVEREWDTFVAALRDCATEGHGFIEPNRLRPRLRDQIKPQRIGAFVTRAKAEGLIAWEGGWQVSDDHEGRNSGRPARVYRWTGGAS